MAANTPGLEAAYLEITSGIARFAFTTSLNNFVDDSLSKPSDFARASAAATQKWNDNLSDLFVPADKAKSDSK